MKSIDSNPKVLREKSNQTIHQIINLEPLLLDKNAKSNIFKSRILKRQKSEQNNFSEVFLSPRQQALEKMNLEILSSDKSKFTHKNQEIIQKFEKQKQDKQNIDNKQSIENKKETEYVSGQPLIENQQGQSDIYSNQIRIQYHPIDGNEQTGNQYGSYLSALLFSFPTNLMNSKNASEKDLKIRTNRNGNKENNGKEAQINFLLGEKYLANKNYSKAKQFYQKVFDVAKIFGDLLVLSILENRIGICEYCLGNYAKSLRFHLESLRHSENVNNFQCFYNIGINFRKLENYEKADENFQCALTLATQKGDQNFQCLALGQIALTYEQMQMYQLSIKKFEVQTLFIQMANQICGRLKNKSLKLCNLRHILRISSTKKLKSILEIQRMVQQAFQCAKDTHNQKILDILRCNIGIVKGIQEINNLLSSTEIEEIEQL